VSAVMNLWIPLNAGNFLSGCTIDGFSWRAQLHEWVSEFLEVGWDWVHLVRRPLIGLFYQPRMIDDECGAVGVMRIGRGNRSTRRNAAPVPLCPPQIPHDLTWARTTAAAVGRQRLTAWAMPRFTSSRKCGLVDSSNGKG
jgi:hypothetical protein